MKLRISILFLSLILTAVIFSLAPSMAFAAGDDRATQAGAATNYHNMTDAELRRRLGRINQEIGRRLEEIRAKKEEIGKLNQELKDLDQELKTLKPEDGDKKNDQDRIDEINERKGKIKNEELPNKKEELRKLKEKKGDAPPGEGLGDKGLEQLLQEKSDTENQIAANEEAAQGNQPSQHGKEEGGKQQPPPPPPPPQKQDDSPPPPENPPEPQQPNLETPEVKKPEDKFEGQLADLSATEEIEEPVPLEPIEVPELDTSNLFAEQPPVEETEEIIVIPEEPAPAKATPARTSLTVDEEADPGGENAPTGGANVFTGLGGSSNGSDSPLVATGYTGLEEEEDDGHRGVRAITEATRGGGGGTGGSGGDGPANSMGLDLNQFLGAQGGTMTLGGGPMSTLNYGPKDKKKKKDDGKLKLPLKLKMYLVMNNQRVLGSTRKFRNRIILKGSKRKLKAGQAPEGFYNRVGGKLNVTAPVKGALKESSKQTAPKRALASKGAKASPQSSKSTAKPKAKASAPSKK